MTDSNCLLLGPVENERRQRSQRRRLVAHVHDAPLRIHPPADEAESGSVDLDSGRPTSARRRGLFALMDQGAVSLGNCATNVLLVRGLPPDQYGSLAIVLEAMLFLNTLHAALVTYPLSVRGSVLDKTGLRRLAGACLLLTAALAIPLGAGVFAAAGALSAPMAGILATFALVLWQCQETLRRAMMSQGGHGRALPADVVSYVGQAVAVFVLVATKSLTIERAFAVMGLTSGLAVVIQSLQIGPTFGAWRELKQTAQDFWSLGRWVMFGSFTAVVTTLSCTWTLAYFRGTGSVAQFQALAGLLKFSNPLTICMAGLIVPAAARAFRTRGLGAARRVALQYGLLTAGILAPYYAFLVIVPATALQLLYGRSTPYATLVNPLRAFVLWYATLLVAQIASNYLNAVEQSRRGFIATLAQAGTVVIVALPLTAMYGLTGLLTGGVIGNIVLAGVTLLMVRRVQDRPVDAIRRFVEDEMQSSAAAEIPREIPRRIAA